MLGGAADIVEKIATRTRTGYIPQMRKTNQDSSLTLKDFAKVPKLWMLGVMDGHGAVGHQVSQYVKVNLPTILHGLMNGLTAQQACEQQASKKKSTLPQIGRI